MRAAFPVIRGVRGVTAYYIALLERGYAEKLTSLAFDKGFFHAVAAEGDARFYEMGRPLTPGLKKPFMLKGMASGGYESGLMGILEFKKAKFAKILDPCVDPKQNTSAWWTSIPEEDDHILIMFQTTTAPL